MADRKSHLIEIDPVERLYHHKQLVSFPGIAEIIFLFRRAKGAASSPNALLPPTAAPQGRAATATTSQRAPEK